MLVSEILNRASTELTDTQRISWGLEDLISYYNSAIAAIASARPDIFIKTQAFACVAGTRQTAPAGTIKLIDIERNTLTGKSIRYVSRANLESLIPSWASSTGGEEAELYIHEPTNISAFWLYPGVKAGVSVDLVLSILPTPATRVTVESGAHVEVDDRYITPCLDWIMYRAFMRDSEVTANASRGQLHLQSFTQALSVRTETDATMLAMRDSQASTKGLRQ
ncbi:phage adaptor protein [Aeromonas aquatilis]